MSKLQKPSFTKMCEEFANKICYIFVIYAVSVFTVFEIQLERDVGFMLKE